MAGFGGQSFQIFSDSSNAENQNAFYRKSKREEKSLKPPATKRAALGEISNNTRVQPLRAAKQGQANEDFGAVGCEKAAAKAQCENAAAKTQKFQFSAQTFSSIGQAGGSFKIHVDRTLPAPTAATLIKPIAPTTVASSVCASVGLSPESFTPDRDELELHPSVTALHAHTPLEPIVIDDDDDDDDNVDDDDDDNVDVDDDDDDDEDDNDDASYELEDTPMLLDLSDCEEVERKRKENKCKILTVPHYSQAIYENLLQLEAKFYPSPYMKKQIDINCNMRSILVDWLIEVAEEYKLGRETLMLAVNYIDRFLSRMAVNRKKLQLVGAASMFLASKYEEIYPPEVTEFVYITDNTYTKDELLKMENLILKVLTFDLSVPTINVFCERFLSEAGLTEDDETYHLTMMLSELTLLDSETYLQFYPSQIAASCMLLANHTLKRFPSWPSYVEESTRYSVKDLYKCVHALCYTYSQAPKHPQKATFDKYKTTKRKQVSCIRPPKEPPLCCVTAMRS